MREGIAAMLVLLAVLAANAVRADVPVEIQTLKGVDAPPIAAVVSGALDAQFGSASRGPKGPRHDVWLRLGVGADPPAGSPVLIVHATRGLETTLYAARDAAALPLPVVSRQAGFLGVVEQIHLLPDGFTPAQPLYAHVHVTQADTHSLDFSASSLQATLERGVRVARNIALAVGALLAVSVTALLIWFVLVDRLFVLYAALFALQALYVAFLSGQGFDWPGLTWAQPLGSFAWNVPVALSGAVACLFTREIADLQRSSRAIYAAFGWLALAFVLLAAANLGRYAGLEPLVNTVGNLMFLGAPVFTLVVCFFAWRRGNRAAGWFLLAWGLLEAFTMAAAYSFLTRGGEDDDAIHSLGLPLSMVAASILTALGVADRLRAQRLALSDAERRAQTDALTGVLNRRSLLERLEAACQRAQARGLPIALLFIDLDHFKQINDTYGHAAGDACLKAVIAPIQSELRQSDVIGRYGGEEFVVILSSADASAAAPLAQRILERVAQVQVEGFGAPIRLTCSIGLATSDTLGLWGEQLVAQADAAVYVAKRGGRNQVHLARAITA